jgi:hypothetical protein
MSRIPEPQPQISFISAGTQLEIAHNAEMKELQPKCLTQESKEHFYFSEGDQARFPAWFFYLAPQILDRVYIKRSRRPVNEFGIGLP